MGEVFIWRLFNQVAIKPTVWGEQTDKATLEKTLQEDMPQVLDYLEVQVPAEGFIFGSVSIADISIACFFRNATFARFQLDAARWPGTAAFVERVLRLESFEKLKPIEERLRRTPLMQHRAALMEMGVPITQDTYGTAKPPAASCASINPTNRANCVPRIADFARISNPPDRRTGAAHPRYRKRASAPIGVSIVRITSDPSRHVSWNSTQTGRAPRIIEQAA